MEALIDAIPAGDHGMDRVSSLRPGWAATGPQIEQLVGSLLDS
jgi:hypothetical protein